MQKAGQSQAGKEKGQIETKQKKEIYGKYQEYVMRIQKSANIDNKIIDFITSSHEKYLYGNGLQTSVCLGIFKNMDVPVQGIVNMDGMVPVTLHGYWKERMQETRLYTISSLTDREEKDILLTVPREFYSIAEQYLSECGFGNIYTCCWDRNQYMKNICYEVYQEKCEMLRGKEQDYV